MSWGPRRHGLAALLAALTLVSLVGAGSADAASDELDPKLDNPQGCTTATAEDQEQCGAQGRDHFANAAHEPPVDACADSKAPSGSRLTRLLADGPRRPDGSLAFVSGACVYLPPGYGTSGLRYPSLYVLHGGGGDQADWVTFGDIQGILDRAYAKDPSRAVIAIMPDGRSGQFYDYEDSSFRIETYVLDHLVPFVDRHFRTIDDRAGRGIVGLSNGGYGAIHFAGKRPDLFIAAGGMSSNLGARTLSGLGEDGAVHHQGSVPYQLAENYDEVDLVLDIGNVCTSPDPLCATIAVDLLFTPDHVAFEQRMNEIGHKGDLDLRHADGAHQYTWWKKWLEERQLPYLQERLADPRRGEGPSSGLPESFRYRTIRPRFSVWGYDVAVQRGVREFLDLRDVTVGGLTVQGSGTATIVTAPRYQAGTTYSVAGAQPGGEALSLTADPAGRLTIPVDLGPSHAQDQFTDAADAAAATGDYWVVRTVTISASPGGPPVVDDASGPGAGGFSSSGGAAIDRGAAPADLVGGTDDRDAEQDAANDRPPATAATLAAFEAEPQLVPTLLFIAALVAGPAAWWTRRRRAHAAEPA